MLSGNDHRECRKKHTRKEDVFDDLKDTDPADCIIEDDLSEVGQDRYNYDTRF